MGGFLAEGNAWYGPGGAQGCDAGSSYDDSGPDRVSDARSVFAELGESRRAEAFLLMYRQMQQELPAAIPWLLDYPRRIQERGFFPRLPGAGKGVPGWY
jgi:hypothetical protein